MNFPDMAHGSRLRAHSAVSTALALLSDRALAELVDAAVPVGAGIGGKAAVLEVTGLARADRDGRYALVRAYAAGERPTGMPEGAAAVLTRHAPVAAVMSGFNRAFQNVSRQTPYPWQELAEAEGTSRT